MSEKSKPEIILEIVKMLLWPVIIFTAVLWFGNDIKDMLKNRSFKIGLVEVGDRINNLEGSVQGKLILQKDNLDQILKNANDSVKVRELTEKAIKDIKEAQIKIQVEVEDIGKVVPKFSQTLSEQNSNSSSETLTATYWENLGFKALLDCDIDEVINSLTKAEKLKPDLHNVSEIRRLFVKNKSSLKDPDSENWKIVYEKTLKDYSWGMPSNTREKMQEYIKN